MAICKKSPDQNQKLPGSITLQNTVPSSISFLVRTCFPCSSWCRCASHSCSWIRTAICACKSRRIMKKCVFIYYRALQNAVTMPGYIRNDFGTCRYYSDGHQYHCHDNPIRPSRAFLNVIPVTQRQHKLLRHPIIQLSGIDIF